MKRVLLPVLLLLALTLTACQSAVPMGQDPYAFAALGRAKAPRTPDKTVAVWVSYLDYKPMLTGKTEQQFRDACEQMLDNMAPLSVNTVYFQVRPFSDSLYPSAFFPRSAFAPGSGSEFAFDPLAVLLELAGARNIAVWAWINPYRITSGSYGDAGFLAQWEKEGAVLVSGALKMLDPANEQAVSLIAEGAGEVCRNYAVEGVIFDDYFYPADRKADAESYARYTSGGGTLPQAAWRCENVAEMVRAVSANVRAAGKLFAISPAGSIPRNRDSYGLDIEALCREGLLDAVSPQIYYGYQNQAMPYESTLKSWLELCEQTQTPCVVSLAAYKSGRYDTYARAGSGEWQTSFDILARQYKDAAAEAGCAGIALFRYGSLFGDDEAIGAFAVLERENLKEALG